jgi:hydrogenase maturation protease
MNPMTALQMVRTLGGDAGHLLIVGCEPAVLETEEMGLTGPVRAAVPEAVALVEKLVREMMGPRESPSEIESAASA